jgi:hypothetical protein
VAYLKGSRKTVSGSERYDHHYFIDADMSRNKVSTALLIDERVEEGLGLLMIHSLDGVTSGPRSPPYRTSGAPCRGTLPVCSSSNRVGCTPESRRDLN